MVKLSSFHRVFEVVDIPPAARERDTVLLFVNPAVVAVHTRSLNRSDFGCRGPPLPSADAFS